MMYNFAYFYVKIAVNRLIEKQYRENVPQPIGHFLQFIHIKLFGHDWIITIKWLIFCLNFLVHRNAGIKILLFMMLNVLISLPNVASTSGSMASAPVSRLNCAQVGVR